MIRSEGSKLSHSVMAVSRNVMRRDFIIDELSARWRVWSRVWVGGARASRSSRSIGRRPRGITRDPRARVGCFLWRQEVIVVALASMRIPRRFFRLEGFEERAFGSF